MQNDISNVVTMLQEAKMLNNDLGRHVRRASFSTHLSGRFYQNNSLESHKARSNRISKMKAERRKLEKFLELEEKKIKFLEERLHEKQTERRREENKRMIQNLSCIKIQSSFRCFSAYNKLQLLRVERDIKVYVVLWLQSIFRGNRDRCLVQTMKDELYRQLKEKSASICIQTHMRQYIAKNRLSEKRQENIIRKRNAACIMQALVRGRRDRCKAKRRRQELAAVLIQRVYRGFNGRKLRDKKRLKKTKRIPLHERRYSSYGAVDISRRGSMSSKNVSNVANNWNRRTSLPGWDVLRKAVSTEAAKVKKPLKQVVDRIPSRCIPTNVDCSSVQSKATSSTKTSYKLKEKPKKSQRTNTLVTDNSKNPKGEGMRDHPSTDFGSLKSSTKIRYSTEIAAYEGPADTNSNNCDCSKEDEKKHLNHSVRLEKSTETKHSNQDHGANVEEDEKANQNHLVLPLKSPKAPLSSQEHNINAKIDETENRNESVLIEKSPRLIDSNHENVIHLDNSKIEQHRKPPQTADDHNESVLTEKSPRLIDSNQENVKHADNEKSEQYRKSPKTTESYHKIELQSSSTHALHSQRSITQRALQMIRKKKAEEEEQRRIKKVRKAELQKLEEERRSKMKKEMEERKARKAAKSLSKKKNNQTILPISDVKHTGKITKTENISTADIAPQKKSNVLVISSQIEIDVSFLDGPFDQDCIETEFDLD